MTSAELGRPTSSLVDCRETERNEFSEAKDRLKHSWAADRDDFARVKDALKKKNADHHVQNGRLSQALKVLPGRTSSLALLRRQAACLHDAFLPVTCVHQSARLA